MEPLIGFLSVMAGLLIRFGIPLSITIVMVWVLRKLDAHWQREAEQVVVLEQAQSELFPTLRCWILNDCPEERKLSCPAYLEAQRPCWQVFRQNGGRLEESCLDCDVLRRAPIPAQV